MLVRVSHAGPASSLHAFVSVCVLYLLRGKLKPLFTGSLSASYNVTPEQNKFGAFVCQ